MDFVPGIQQLQKLCAPLRGQLIQNPACSRRACAELIRQFLLIVQRATSIRPQIAAIVS
jgi:hypothetical protein